MGASLTNPEAILSDSKACLRVITALKAGRAPKEGIRFLSVGLDGISQQLSEAFEQAKNCKPRILWLIGDYGEGKSHLLRFVTALAKEHAFAYAYVVHDKDQLIGLHKPARLFCRILWELQWEHPSVKFLWEFNEVMTKPPVYDRWWRYTLPQKLKDLTEWLGRQGYQGLVVCLDELENCYQFHWNQHQPAYETLNGLYRSLDGSVLLFLAITENGLNTLKWLWDFYDEAKTLFMPPWREEYALPLAERIHQLHAKAFDWEPKISPKEIAQRAGEQAKKAKQATSGRWRNFVQAAVQMLEIEHQQVVTYVSPHKPTPPVSPPSKPIPLPPTLQPLPRQPTFQPGEQVEIVKTSLRGFRGTIEQVKGDKAEVVLAGRFPARVWLPLDALKKLR